MREININIKIDDLHIAKDSSVKTGGELFLRWIENAIISSFMEENKSRMITEIERRRVHKLMSELEAHQDGKVSMSDQSFSFMQERWKAKKFPAETLRKPFRRLITRMDEVIVPDESKS